MAVVFGMDVKAKRRGGRGAPNTKEAQANGGTTLGDCEHGPKVPSFGNRAEKWKGAH